MAGAPWIFTQLAGDKKTLRLDGWARPFGMPRKGAVVRDGVEVRKRDVYYNGLDARPTRHIFGDKLEPFELKGRFSDRADNNAKGFAKAKTEEVKGFVRDKQPVRVTWGDVIDVEGFISKFSPGREAEWEVEWTMNIDVDFDNFAQRKRPIPPSFKPADSSMALKLAMEGLADDLSSLSLTGFMSGMVDSVLGPVNGVLNAIDNFATAVGSFETATFEQITKFEALAGRAADVCKNIGEIVTNAEAGAAMVAQSGEENSRLWAVQSTRQNAVRRAQMILGEMLRQADAAKAGGSASVAKSVLARGGGTWDTLAGGDNAAAAAMKDANDVAGGEKPVPGWEYLAPGNGG
jgi:hypothetical protein